MGCSRCSKMGASSIRIKSKFKSKSKSTSMRTQTSATIFYNELRKQLDEYEIYSIRYLFHTIKVSEYEICDSLCKFMKVEGFYKKFKLEWQKLKKLGLEKDGDADQSLRAHCSAVIWAHLDIVKNIHDPMFLNDKLDELSMCHCVFYNLPMLLKLHDNLLYKFVRNEFDGYHQESTLVALRKYLKLVSDRMIALSTEQMELYDLEDVIQLIRIQRSSIQGKTQDFEKMKEIFLGRLETQVSELSLADDTYTRPGASWY